jgi:hypothetical protein
MAMRFGYGHGTKYQPSWKNMVSLERSEWLFKMPQIYIKFDPNHD